MNFVALCVNGLVAYPPAWHPQFGKRGRDWPRHMANELAAQTGLGLASRGRSSVVVHGYVDVTDQGENLVGRLGLQTVPTHVLVDAAGRLVSVLARKQFPNGGTVEALTGCCLPAPLPVHS